MVSEFRRFQRDKPKLLTFLYCNFDNIQNVQGLITRSVWSDVPGIRTTIHAKCSLVTNKDVPLKESCWARLKPIAEIDTSLKVAMK